MEVGVNTCIYSKTTFAQADAEHILQNFLGARWVSAEIVSNEVQGDFGRTIDVALEKALQPIRNLLGTQGGRGGPGPTIKRLPTTAGEVIDLEPGGVPRIAKPQVSVKYRSDGKRDVKITLGSVNQLGWALSLLREQIPDLKVDVNQVRALAQSVSSFVEGRVNLSVCIGGNDYFRGLLKSCMNLIGACDPTLAFDPCLDAARDFILTGSGDSQEFVRWSTQADPVHVPSLGRADHFIYIASIRGGIEGVVQFFGGIVHPIRLATAYTGKPFHYSYQVNPFRDTTPAEKRNSLSDPSCIPVFSLQAIEQGTKVWDVLKTRLDRLVRLYLDIANEALVRQAIEEVLKPEDGNLFTEELAGKLSMKIAQLVSHKTVHKETP